MRIIIVLTTFLLIMAVLPYQFGHQTSQDIYYMLPHFADTLYHNGTILTMDPRHPTASFVAVKNGKISRVGQLAQEMKLYLGKQTKVIDLHGKTMLPGFIDAHTHFGNTAVLLAQPINIKSPPFGPVISIKELLATVKNYITEHNIPEGEVVYAQGYSDIDLIQKRNPTRYELDWVSDKNPIYLRHFTEHQYACNSMGLGQVGYSELTPNPKGGYLDRYPNGTLMGVVREMATIPIFSRYAVSIYNLTSSQIKQTEDLYFSVGVTTAQEIPITLKESRAYVQMGDSLRIDINSYVWVHSRDLANYYQSRDNLQTDRYQIKGVKFMLDGSIQAYTALLTQPYWVPESQINDDLDNYTYNKTRSCQSEKCGIDYFPDKKALRQLLLETYENGIDVLAHCNGDKASDNFLEGLAWAKINKQVDVDTRFVMIHAQTVREDQLDRMVELEVHPSFFSPHIYFWGDMHLQLFLGPKRALSMNPARSAIKRNLIPTLHNDSPAVMTGIFQGINTYFKILESAVSRKTKSGKVLGPQQKITMYEALQGITINAAWQSRSEKTKGSIAVGKLADFVILSENPLDHEDGDLSQLKVVGTVKKDKLVYGHFLMGFTLKPGKQMSVGQ